MIRRWLKPPAARAWRALPPVRRLHAEIRRLIEETARHEADAYQARAELTRWRERAGELEGELARWRTWAPPGHFYSPIPSAGEVRERRVDVFDRRLRPLPGIDLGDGRQEALLRVLAEHCQEHPWGAERVPGRRYFFDNPNFSYSDALFLYGMIRHSRPRRILEIGSGYSTCAMLDTNEQCFENTIAVTCVEPYPELLLSLLREGDRERIDLWASGVQAIPLDRFRALEPADILFIDSSHVAKTGSDVNDIFFRILPALPSGVRVHLHDVFYPFEYPEEWVQEGRAWNEDYLLRAFLQYNEAFEIELFGHYVHYRFPELMRERMPLAVRNPGGSMWLRKR